MYHGNNRRCEIIFFSQKWRDELIAGYYAKAERDYDEAIEFKATVSKGKPPKKYQNFNCFLKTSVGHVFPSNLTYRRESIEGAARERIISREDAFKGLKHGIDIRPLGCRDENSPRWHVLIAYLALTAMYLSKHLSPQLSTI